MNAQMSILIKIAIFSFCCALSLRNSSAHSGYRVLPESKFSDSESSEEDITTNGLQQHPWERHRLRHRHRHIYQNDLDFLNGLATNRGSENPRSNVPIFISHPWHMHEPHRRHRFHHRRWRDGLFQQGKDEFSREGIQVSSGNGAETAITGNNYNSEGKWEGVESLETSSGRQNPEETMHKTVTLPITNEIKKSTTIIPKVLYETTTTADITTTIEPTENTYAIDIRSGF